MIQKLKLWFKKNWFFTIKCLIFFISGILLGSSNIALSAILLAIWFAFSAGYNWFNNHKIIDK